jgi:hypothetical protein
MQFLHEADLTEMGIDALGPRRRIMAAIKDKVAEINEGDERAQVPQPKVAQLLKELSLEKYEANMNKAGLVRCSAASEAPDTVLMNEVGMSKPEVSRLRMQISELSFKGTLKQPCFITEDEAFQRR